jgi:hypothetical protein
VQRPAVYAPVQMMAPAMLLAMLLATLLPVHFQ